jgi:hypothetical protein
MRSKKTRFVGYYAVRQEYDEARWRDWICDVDGRVELKVGGSRYVFGPSWGTGGRLTENIDVLLQSLCRVIAQLAAPFDFLKCAPVWDASARELCDG